MIRVCLDCGTRYEKGFICPKCGSDNSDSPKWVNKINIKDKFKEHPTDADVLDCCNAIVPQLETVMKNNQGVMSLDDCYSLDECIDAFKEIGSCIEKGIEYVGEEVSYVDEFNHWLDELYFLGDMIVSENRFHHKQYFLWVG